MQAIQTKYIGASNYRQSRIKAVSGAGTLTINYDSALNSDANHEAVARALIAKYEWPTNIVGGTLRSGDMVWVISPKRESFPRGEMMREAMKRSTFVAAYVEALFFTESGDDNLKEAGVDDMSFDIVTRIIRDCNVFETAHAVEIENGAGSRQAGHDFWLTRNGHGAGFWGKSDWDSLDGERMTATCKAFGEMSVYIGDDGLIY